ncbi:MAG: DUF3794 domain-containing protein [Oscillospiraceae bacterium]|jgi:hypothetical protein|nr:DUF3794 domain-containing protein [Oscillospiraceae bacterium]
MEFKVNRNMVAVNETVYDGLQEQSIELDYVLPDYCPEIFKIVKTKVKPRVVSRSIAADRASYDLVVNITVMYLSENSNALQCLKQKLNYTKVVEFGKSYENVEVCLCPKVDYVNCRAVNSKRIDLRGAVSIKVKVTADRKQEIITDATGCNSQLKKEQVKYAGGKLSGEKQINLSEETEINASKPSIQSIVASDAVVIPGEKKVIANKVVASGETVVKFLYSCEKEGKPSLEPLEVTIPYKQIIDVDGVDDTYDVTVTPTLSNVESTATGGVDGAFKRVNIEVAILLVVKASKVCNGEIVTDAYSTSYPCEYSTSKIRLETTPVSIRENTAFKSDLQTPEQETVIHDIWTDITNVNVNVGNGEFTVSGMAVNTVIGTNADGTPFTIDNNQPFDYTIQYDKVTPLSTVDVDVTPAGTQYTLNTNSTISIKNDIKISATVTNSEEYEALTDINFDSSTPLETQGDYALKLYYGSQGENLWDIAKRYNSSVNSIVDENEQLENASALAADSMILIPILA